MNIVNLVQGTQEWLAHRANFFNASDAPAMMGVSPYKTRSELLKELFSGVTAEVSPTQQDLYDEGHRCEALYRPIAEQIVGDELYPVVGTEGKLSASFDGMTMSEETAYEHKLLNNDLRKAFDDIATVAPEYRDAEAGRLLPMVYQVQMEQQCMIGKCKRVLFAASRWSRAGEMEEERHCWYYPNPELAAKLSAGWEQFEKDLLAYEPEVAEVKPVGRTPETLPALFVEVRGQVTASNLKEFRDHAIAVFQGINRNLSTDQDFADAEKTVKWCGEVESKLAAAKQHALSQTQSIDELFRTIDDISAEARRVRLDLDKLVTLRKTEVKEAIIRGGRDAYAKHIQSLKEETGGAWVELGAPDFVGAAKGKRSVSSIQDAVDTLLANAKIDADASAKRIRANVVFLDRVIEGYEFLFADRVGLAAKQIEDLRLVVSSRIDKHKADELRKEEEQRERIRREEQAKAEREQREAKEAEDSLISGIWKNARRIEADSVPYIQKAIRTFESMAGDWENDPRPRVAEAIASARDEMQAKLKAAEARELEAKPVASPAPTPAPAPAARPTPVARQAPARRPAPPTRPTDAEIIAALVSHFEATEEQVVGWLCEMDFSVA